MRRLAALAVLLVTPALHALEPTRPLNQFGIRQFQEGLPQNSIQAVRQTRDGYLWIATYEGLTRFDGTRFVTFNRGNTPAFKVSGVFRLFEDSRGTLWIGTLGGGAIALANGKFTSYATEGTFVRGFDEDASGAIWIATDRGLSIVRNGAVAAPPSDSRLNSDIRGVARGNDGAMWVATAAGTLLRVSNSIEEFGAEANIPRQMVILTVAKDGAVWIGAESGAWRFTDGKTMAIATGNVRALYADRDGAVWIGFDGGGLLRWYNGNSSHLGLADGLSSDIVRSFWQDREGTLWIGTNGGGLNALRRDKIVTFATEAGLRSNDVRCVLQDRARTIWVGTAGGGVTRFTPNGLVNYGTAEGLPGTYVRTLAEDGEGRVWIGTFGGGAARFDNGSFEKFGIADGLPTNNLNTIIVRRSGEVWVQTDLGVVRFVNGRFVPALDSAIYAKRTVKSIYEDKKGNLWIGFVGELMRWNDGAVQKFPLPGNLNNQSIFTMYDDGHENLWLGTDGGLVRFRDGKFRVYRAADGLFDDTAFSVIEDGRANLWMTSNHGIYRVAKSDLDKFDAGTIKRIPSTGYGKADGMRTDQANGNTTPAAFKAADGRIWFATVRGVSVIDPADIPVNALAPPVAIEDVIAGEGGKVEFHYAALSFIAPERVLFKYKLEGFDPAWVDAGTRRTAYYTNVPPGDYRFRVIASNNDGVWNDRGASVPINLPAPLWLTWWAKAAYALAIAALIWLVVRWRIRSLKQRAAELEQRVRERTARALESEQRALDASQAKSAFLANMSHELRTPLNAIIGYSEMLEEEASDGHKELIPDLRKIRTAGKHLLELINNVLDLSKIEAGKMTLTLEPTDVRNLVEEVAITAKPLVERNANALEVECPRDVGVVSVDVTKTRQILLNLLSNASKFTDHGRVRLEVARRSAPNGASIEFLVADTGIGMDTSQLDKLFQPFMQVHDNTARKYGGTGLGLALSQRFCHMMGGDIRVESQRGAGTKFIVRLPVADA